jgi:MFS transporter, ACDE family, multidrug resistance protein
MATPILPELSAGLGTSLNKASWAVTAYMIPFALVMLVSGTLGERWGRARTMQWAYVGYAVGSLACAVAPSLSVFLLARGVQGVAQAFTSPLLVAAISDAVAPRLLGRALGAFGSLQAAGQAFAPLVGGAAAAVDYRLAFIASALAASMLAVTAPSDSPEPPRAHRPSHYGWRALANRRVAVACSIAFCLYLATTGLQLLVALRASDRFGLGPDVRGLVVAAFGTAGLLTAPRMGRLADRFGVRAFGITVLGGFGGCVLMCGLAPALWLLLVLVAGAGVTSTASRVTVNALAVRSTPENRGGAASLTQAWMFLGSALAPVLLLPVYTSGAATGFTVAAALMIPAVAVLAVAGENPVTAAQAIVGERRQRRTLARH